MKWISVWDKRPFSPYLMYAATEATVKGLKKVFPPSKITQGCSYWKNGIVQYLYPGKELLDTVNSLSAKAIKSPNFLLIIHKKALEKSIKLKKFSEKYKNKNISKEDSEKLISHAMSAGNKFYDLYSYGTVASLLGYHQETPLYSEMNKILENKTRECPEKFAEYLSILTNAPKVLKSKTYELEMLKLSLRARERKITAKKEIKIKLFKEIDLIKNKYQWLSFDLCDSLGWDTSHYVNSIFENIKRLDVKDRIIAIENYNVITAREYENLCKKLALTKKEKLIFDLVRNLGYYKWAREHEFTEAFYNIKFVQDEIGRRCGLSNYESKFLFHFEYKKAIAEPALYKKIIASRLKNLILVSRAKDATILDGKDAIKEFKKIIIKKDSTSVGAGMKGMPANPGVAKGHVKIVNEIVDLKKMKRGDILVSQATSPDLLSGMRKAAAIITDEGGITCHAAIVSRELNIPCIVGTKNATKILKDGYLVEVDANKGVVKVLK